MDCGISKETWRERKQKIDSEADHLQAEIQSLQAQMETKELSDEQIATLQEFASAITEGLDLTDDDFEARRKIVDMLDVQA